MLDIDALATDYDRTLTSVDVLEPDTSALDALRRARKAGKRVIVVSGRNLAHLVERVGEVADVIVAENGCVLRTREGVTGPIGGVVDDLGESLDGFAVERGEFVASVDVALEPLVREALARAGIRRDFVKNLDRLMLLPPGVDKAVGLLAALELVGVNADKCAAAGDAENDLPMLKVAGYGIAVANAVPELKMVATTTTKEPGGAGLARWIEEEWLA